MEEKKELKESILPARVQDDGDEEVIMKVLVKNKKKDGFKNVK